jgi:GTP diphosphokinase / guanosine-3',5'-bis(diphosphate) 3'-diphosphatase
MIPLDTYFKTLADIRGEELSAEDEELLGMAFELGRKYHAGQTRANGDDYFDGHCIPVSYNVAKIQMPADMIAAALLHDSLEDTTLTRKTLLSVCGKDVTFMVDGVSKLSKVKYQGNDRHVESLRKFFVATAKDVRVVILKLCDRWHNLSTLEFLPEQKRERIAKESILIHAQLASRLNMGQLSSTLKDLAFPYAYPESYAKTMKTIGPRLALGESVIDSMFDALHPIAIDTLGYEPQIDKRLKGVYSAYKKLLRKNWSVSEVYDLVALRVVVNSREECYRMLGAIHSKWHPLPARLKDYIALPKPNGYQSLHTTVMSGTGLMVEIQIRTKEMHFVNEYGVAAHHSYKDRIGDDKQGTFAWMDQLSALKDRQLSPEEYIHELESDFFETRIFALTPMGDVIDLPSGATVLDFAYAVHSDIGNKAKGAYVNGRYKPIYAKVNSESVVDVVTSTRVMPSEKWLDYIMTSHAKSKILKALHHEPEAR